MTSIGSDDEQEYIYSDDDYEYHMDDDDEDMTTTSTTEEDSGMENESSGNDREQQPQPPLCGCCQQYPTTILGHVVVDPPTQTNYSINNISSSNTSNRKRRNPFEIISSPKYHPDTITTASPKYSPSSTEFSSTSFLDTTDDAVVVREDTNNDAFLDSSSKIEYYESMHTTAHFQLQELRLLPSLCCQASSFGSASCWNNNDLQDALVLVMECCKVLCVAYIRGIYFSDFLTLYHRDELEVKTQELSKLLEESLLQLLVPKEVTKCLQKLKNTCHKVVQITQNKDPQWNDDDTGKAASTTTSNEDDNSDLDFSLISGISTNNNEEEDDNNDMHDDDEDDEDSATLLDEERKTIQASQIDAHLDSLIDQASQHLAIPKNVATVLLRSHKWDLHSLPTRNDIFGPRSDKTKGVQARCEWLVTGAVSSRPTPSCANLCSSKECYICRCEDMDPSDMFYMPCGHEYCRTCWDTYIATSLDRLGPGSVDAMTCPHDGCTELITEHEIEELSSDIEKLNTFRKYQVQSFVTTSKGLRYCRGTNCSAVLKIGDLSLVSADTSQLPLLLCSSSSKNEVLQIKSSSTNRIAVTKCMECKTPFCAGCGEENHHPVSCQMFQRWLNESALESGYSNASWFTEHTQKCPHCSVRIEKAGGCNNMHCTRCMKAFVWNDLHRPVSCLPNDIQGARAGLDREELEAILAFTNPLAVARAGGGEVRYIPHPEMLGGEGEDSMANIPRAIEDGLRRSSSNPQPQTVRAAENIQRSRGGRLRDLLHLDLLTVGGTARRDRIREPQPLPLEVVGNHRRIPSPGISRGQRRDIYYRNNTPPVPSESNLDGNVLNGVVVPRLVQLTRRNDIPMGIVDNVHGSQESSLEISPEAVLDVFDCIRKYSSLDATHTVMKEIYDNFLTFENDDNSSACRLLERSLESCHILKYSYVFRYCMEHPSSGEPRWTDAQRWSFGKRQNKLESSISLVWKLEKLLRKCAKFEHHGSSITSRTLAVRRFLTNVPELTELSIV